MADHIIHGYINYVQGILRSYVDVEQLVVGILVSYIAVFGDIYLIHIIALAGIAPLKVDDNDRGEEEKDKGIIYVSVSTDIQA